MLQNALNDERNCRLNSGSNVKSKKEKKREEKGKNRREDPKFARKSLRSKKYP